MVESSDLQGAIQRTQATERIASLQNQQEELNRKRFELETARDRAERAKKAQDVDGTGKNRKVIRDEYDGDGRSKGQNRDKGQAQDRDDPDAPETGGIDVRV